MRTTFAGAEICWELSRGTQARYCNVRKCRLIQVVKTEFRNLFMNNLRIYLNIFYDTDKGFSWASAALERRYSQSPIQLCHERHDRQNTNCTANPDYTKRKRNYSEDTSNKQTK